MSAALSEASTPTKDPAPRMNFSASFPLPNMPGPMTSIAVWVNCPGEVLDWYAGPTGKTCWAYGSIACAHSCVDFGRVFSLVEPAISTALLTKSIRALPSGVSVSPRAALYNFTAPTSVAAIPFSMAFETKFNKSAGAFTMPIGRRSTADNALLGTS